VRALIQRLASATPGFAGNSERYAIIRALALYRSVEASDALVELLTFQMCEAGVGERYPLELHPAADAIAQIGLPAYHAIFRRLGHDATNDELKLIAYVLSWHDGRLEKETGQFVLQRHRSQSHAASELCQNLDKIAEIIGSVDFGKMSDWPGHKSLSGKLPDSVPSELIK